MRARNNRLARLKQAIDASPVRRGVLREAYLWFKDFGELDDDDRVADVVVRQALRGGAEQPVTEDGSLESLITLTVLGCEQHKRAAHADHNPHVREALFCEAMDANPYTRRLARAAVATEVAHGGNVEDPAFAAHHGIPKHNSLALHMHGWPGKLSAPPYEEQAKRLFLRLDAVRGRVPQDDPAWFDEQAEALVRFYATGALPDDDLHLDALLVNVEIEVLAAHRRGKNVKAVMAALDRVARTVGKKRAQAVARVQEFVQAGPTAGPRR